MSDDNKVVALFKGASLPSMDVGKFRQGLQTAQQVAGVAGNTPFLRMLKSDGSWVYGANETEVQEGSKWAINPTTLKVGYIAWAGAGGGKPLGKRMQSIFLPPILRADLPDVGGDWDENVSFELQCMNGEDKGLSVEYTANSYGGRAAFSDLVAALQKQLDTDVGHIVPVVLMKSTKYKHATYGWIYNPVFEIAEWISMQGPNDAAKTEAAAAGDEPKPVEPPSTKPKRAPVEGAPAAAAQPTAQQTPANTTAPVEPTPAPEPPQPVTRRRRRAAAAD